MTVILSVFRVQASNRICPGGTTCGLPGAWPHHPKPRAGMRPSTTTPTYLSGGCDLHTSFYNLGSGLLPVYCLKQKNETIPDTVKPLIWKAEHTILFYFFTLQRALIILLSRPFNIPGQRQAFLIWP